MIELSGENFKENIEKSILVDFWASWCGSCKMLTNVLENIEFDNVEIGKINVDENEDVARQYNILNLPTCILFQEGKEINRFFGYKNKEQIEQFIKEVLSV